MSTTPPFDPPYKMSTVLEDGSVKWMEVRADGSMVEASAPAVVLPAADAPAPRAGQSGQSGRAVTVLNVPFAEKERGRAAGCALGPETPQMVRARRRGRRAVFPLDRLTPDG